MSRSVCSVYNIQQVRVMNWGWIPKEWIKRSQLEDYRKELWIEVECVKCGYQISSDLYLSAAKPNLSNFRGPQPSRSPRHGISDLEPELLYPWRLRIYRLATKQQNDLPACWALFMVCCLKFSFDNKTTRSPGSLIPQIDIQIGDPPISCIPGVSGSIG